MSGRGRIQKTLCVILSLLCRLCEEENKEMTTGTQPPGYDAHQPCVGRAVVDNYDEYDEDDDDQDDEHLLRLAGCARLALALPLDRAEVPRVASAARRVQDQVQVLRLEQIVDVAVGTLQVDPSKRVSHRAHGLVLVSASFQQICAASSDALAPPKLSSFSPHR
eukprot:242488-Pleurochrysis_carterae.AAC.3